ncbi:DUF2065 domain-containing protein [Marivibrio halodurans]|uniref:DUF2065 domain-containing protein n=1 Tax=Marivibrio halodurans TaxID=2039722 RepID=A0A8J7S080_9PROT|nr:DUF2065 domain-containing protein [Marivibrio halodurans]MBP5857900.1 DUF2065 domain-containing protein [Marivibrio halodurans]
MDDFWTAILTALGLVFVIEGMAYALFPEGAKRLAALAQSLPAGSLRRGGLIAAIAGALLVWLVRG